MVLPRKRAFPYYMNDNMTFSSSAAYRASSDSRSRMKLPAQTQEYTPRIVEVGEAPMEPGYTTPAQTQQPYSYYSSQMPSNIDTQYQLSNAHMAYTNSMTEISPLTADRTPNSTDGSGSTQSGSEYYQGQGTIGTPPSSRGEPRPYSEDHSPEVVAGDASIDFQGLTDPFVGPRIYPQPKSAYQGANLGRATSNVRSFAHTPKSGKGYNVSAEDPWTVPRTIPSSPWSSVDRRMRDSAPGVEILLYAPQPGPVYTTYHDEQGLRDHVCSSMNEDMQSKMCSPFSSVNHAADDEWHHQMPEEMFPACQAQNMYGSESSLLADFASPMSTTTTSTSKNRGGRPVGYRLSVEGAKNARDVRAETSCWHCFFTKKKCSPGTPCRTCRAIANRKGFRIFNLPCDKSTLQDRKPALLPSVLISHLLKDPVKKFVRDNVSGFTNNHFELMFSIGYGEHLRFDAVEFIPTENSELTRSLGIEIVSGKSSRVWRNAPLLSLNLMSCHYVQRDLSKWLDDIIGYKLKGWTDFSCGKNSYGWLRGVLNAVCQFFTEYVQPLDEHGDIRLDYSAEQTTLRRALKLWILTWLMGHQLTIPDDQKSKLNHFLRTNIPLEAPLSPRLVNKLVKSMLWPMVDALASDTLQGLQAFLRSTGAKGTPNWGCVFSTMVLLLAVAAETQTSLDDLAACAVARKDFSMSRDDAAAHRGYFEQHVPNTIITLFYARFKSPKNYNPFQSQRSGYVGGMDPATQELIRNISDAIENDESGLLQNTELSGYEYDQLAVDNVPRLLSKFLNPYFEDKDSRNRRSGFSDYSTDAYDDSSSMAD